MPMGFKNKDGGEKIFEYYSRGLETNRDPWCYNSSLEKLKANIKKSLEFYNSNLELKSGFICFIIPFAVVAIRHPSVS